VQEKVEAVVVVLWELVELEEELVELEVCVLVELEEDDDVEMCVEAELEEVEETVLLELEPPFPEFIERKT
jgi:hypothetical protein